MNFSELIGADIFIGFTGRIGTESSEPGFLRVKLLGVEPSGIWIESDRHSSFFNEAVWTVEMEEWGLEGVGKLSMKFFIPFSEIRFVLALRPRE